MPANNQINWESILAEAEAIGDPVLIQAAQAHLTQQQVQMNATIQAQQAHPVEALPEDTGTTEIPAVLPQGLQWNSPVLQAAAQGITIGGHTPNINHHAQILAEVEQQKLERAKEKARMNGQTFADLVKYSPLQVGKAKHQAFEKGKKPTLPILCNESLFGIEIEVENCPNPPAFDYYWSAKADGSLRNHGAEFVSIPLRPNQVEFALDHLRELVLIHNPKPDFSNRTSVHVHMNARDFTQDNLYCFVLLYSIFERHFYKFAGTKRESSIFCVPLYKTNYLRRLEEFVYALRASWSKYCGLNLAPMFANGHTGCYGTVEFRHLYGTFDPQIIVPWINSILCIRQAALKWTRESLLAELKQMNTVSSYGHMYREVFGDFGLNNQMLKEDFEFCISQVKKELFRTEYSKTLNRHDMCSYFTTIREMGL